MKHVRDMTKAEAADALDGILRAPQGASQQREDARFWAGLRTKHPDLAARADEAAHAAHRDLLKQVVAANEALHTAAAENAVAAKDPSPLARQRAAARLKDAQDTHDALVLKAEASHAALPKQGKPS